MEIQIREFRKRANLTQNELASAVGVKKSTVGMWELSRREPSVATLKKLAELFGCSIDELVGYRPSVDSEGSEESAVREHISALCNLGASKIMCGDVAVIVCRQQLETLS